MKPDLDRIDFELIELLQNNILLSNKELASHVGLAPSTCLARLARLRAQRVLVGGHADIAPEALGIGLQALIAVRLREHSRPHVRSFWRYVRGLKGVLAAYHLAGAHDVLVHVAARDAQHLRDLAMDAFATRPEVAHLETSLIFEFSRSPTLPNYAAPSPPTKKKKATPSRRASP